MVIMLESYKSSNYNQNREWIFWRKHITFSVFIYGMVILQQSGVTFSNKVEPKKPVCLTPGCVHAASDTLKNIDQSIKPCDDFYRFACGGFIKNQFLPDDKPNIISFSIIRDRLIKQLRTMLEEPIQVEEPKSFALLKRFYSICLNTTAIELDNLKTAKKIIEDLGGWPVLNDSTWNEESFDWKTLTYNIRSFGLDTNRLFSVYSGYYAHNTSLRIITIDHATLGLDREYLVKGLSDEMVNAYYNYIVDLAVAFGSVREFALEDLKGSIEFAIEIAKITLAKEDRRNMSALTHIMTLEELQKMEPEIDWIAYLNNMVNIPDIQFSLTDLVDVAVPKYINDLKELLRRTSKRSQANYLMSEAVISMVSFMTEDLRKREMEYSRLFQGTVAMKPRWQECVENSIESLNIAAGALYVRKYFQEDRKESASKLYNYIHKQLTKVLEEVDWMDETTRERALKKVNKMDAHIGYPSEFLDDKKLDEYYAKLLSNSDNYLQLSLNMKQFHVQNKYIELRQCGNKTDWRNHAHATSVDAYYNFIENSVQLPAGILQNPFFDSDRPNYMNFGSMGFAIGHEMTHGFDDLGRQFDQDGVLVDWWEEKTAKAYFQKAQCIIDQYNNYTDLELQLQLNGINTQGENIADNGAVKLSYLAYETWLEHHNEELSLPGLNYTPKQLFWISLANLWCSKERKEYTAQNILSNDHAPSYFRILGAFSSSEYFSKDFNCPLGSKMNPKHKCHIW